MGFLRYCYDFIMGFLRFWYDFIIGDAWEVAVGVVVTLALSWALVRAGFGEVAWLVVVCGVAAALGISLAWQARRSPR